MEPIAIIGIGCRFPGANSPESFWNNLRNGIDSITEVPSQRWDIDSFYHPEPATPGKMHTRWGGFLEQLDSFDASFFGISPREAEQIDPQQRLLLEVSWEALENAGIAPQSLAGSQTGVFIGAIGADYHRFVYKDTYKLNAYSGSGTSLSICANRLSYFFNLKGASILVDTACSSSLVALNLGTQNLLSGESNLCLVGGVNLILSPEPNILLSQARMMAADGRCKTFDANADGYVRGEGCGVVVLKRLQDALRDGDNIKAVIRGSAVNQDGLTNGITAPNGSSQQAVIRQALKKAGVKPAQISYVEAHGTGTALGDPIELNSLKAVLTQDRDLNQTCWIGSVKTNIGHLEGAAGIAGLIKVVLSLQNKEIPPNLHLKKLNPYIKIKGTPIKISTSLQKWSNDSKLASLNSFGFGGTNAHVILEEAPCNVKAQRSKVKGEDLNQRPHHILTLSAKSEPALKELVHRYEEFLINDSNTTIDDICFTANTGRSHFNYRLAIIASQKQELTNKLALIGSGEEVNGVFKGQLYTNNKLQKIVFLFTGQGSQYVNMGRQLYESQPVFRQALEQCDKILQSDLEKSIIEVIYPEKNQDNSNSIINQTAYTQPALFAIEYALYKLWESWGIKPSVVMGHSVGEYVAATVAGVFSLEDGLKLIAHRGRLMQQLPAGGEMLSIMTSGEQVKQFIAPYSQTVAIAAINGPSSVVISGEAETIRKIKEKFDLLEIKTKQLQVSHAFHSPFMEPMLDDFRLIASEITYNKPRIKLISNVTGSQADDSISTADYWVNHVIQPVKFAQSMETLKQLGYQIFLEIGSKPILLGMGRQCITDNQNLWLPSLRPSQSGDPHSSGEWQILLQSLAELYVRGVKIDWVGFDQDYSRSKVVLPTYPFQRQRYWIETDNNVIHEKQLLLNKENLHPLLGKKLHLAGLEAQIRFESQINASQPNYLKHHCIFSQPVFPATGYLEIALAAAESIFNCDNLILEDVVIQQALILSEENIKTIQLILEPQSPQCHKFKIFSLDISSDSPESNWNLHVEGKILAGNKDIQPEKIDLQAIKDNYHNQLDIQYFYQNYRENGFDYGDDFQGLKQLWSSEGKAFAKIQLPESIVSQASKYQLHPVILDASFQALAAALEKNQTKDTYLPVKIKRLQVYRQAGNNLWSQVEVNSTASNSKTIICKVSLFDEQGIEVAKVEGLTLVYTSREALLRNIESDPNRNSWLYQIDWKEQLVSSPTKSNNLTAEGTWLLFDSPTSIGRNLALSLNQSGQNCILVTPGTNYQQLESFEYQINPTQPEDFYRLFQEISENQLPLNGIVHLWSLSEIPTILTSEQLLKKSQELSCGSVLHLVKALVKSRNTTVPLWLITQGSQSVGKESNPIQFQQAPLWGLGKVITLEHQQLQCRLLDLDFSIGETDTAEILYKELSSPDSENQIAYRQGIRYVARLVRQQDIESKQLELKIPSQPFQLKLSQYGNLENLILQPMKRRSPGIGEVEIQVKAVGQNFRDVLNSLGMLKDYYAQHLGITKASQLTFGFECSGTIAAVGEGVTRFQVGDEVIATMLPDAFSSFVTTTAEIVVPKPRNLTYIQAVTIPLAFLTAYYGLHHLAKIQPGDKVLIHAAAGGVGQAAVQLAQQVGAEVFATASASKWEFLKSMGVKYVMNSRSLDFAEEITNLTQGKGVDIVFNSLNGEFITKNFEILAAEGRFVEIGKISIWDENQVKQTRPDAKYFPFDLREVAQQNLGLLPKLLNDLVQQFEQGILKPLPDKVFPIKQVVEAFRYMQKSKHIGKVVVSMEQTVDTQVPIQSDASYLITGGLGALGLQTASWMVEQGAKYLVLTSRKQPSPKAQQTIEELQQAGAQILILSGDISQAADVVKILESIKASLPTLKGVIHAAGVLDDGVIESMSWERFTQVMAPKVQGAWHLHNLTQDLPIEIFVCFSSIASVLGSLGQGNYAAANAFMDSLVDYRRKMGLPGLSINWGPWSQGGMASRLHQEHLSRMQSQGITPINPDQGLQVLEELLKQQIARSGVLSVNWSKFLRQFPNGEYPAFLKEIFSNIQHKVKIKRGETQNQKLLNQLQQASQIEGKQLLTKYLQEQIIKVLQLDSSNPPNPGKSISELGIDSLMGIELRNIIESQLGITLDPTMLLEGSSIVEMVDKIAREFFFKENSSNNKNLQGVITNSVKKVNNWIAYRQINSNPPKMRLFCFHYLGGSASVFREWSDYLPSDVEVCPVQLPGRETRLQEKPFTDFTNLIETLGEALSTDLDKPFAFYGHSLGSWICFELAHLLHQKYGVSLIHLFIGASMFPDDENSKWKLGHFSPKEFLNYMLDISEVPELIRNDKSFEQLMLIFKNDYQLFMSYIYSQKEPLDCPISAFAGIEDPFITQEELSKWNQHTNNTFKLHMIPGKHMFLKSNKKLLLENISRELMTYL